MALRVIDILEFPELAGVRPLAPVGLERQIRWVHTWPEVLPWLHGGELLLTTAYSWPPDPDEQCRIVRELAQAGVAAVLFRAGGEFFAATPPAVVDEATRAGLAVLEATADVSFVDLTETINRAIIRTHFESLERSERIHRELTEAALEAEAVSDIQVRLEQLLGRKALVLEPRGRLLAGDEALGRSLADALRIAHEPSRPDGASVLQDGTAVLRRPIRTGGGAVAELVLVAPPGEPFRDVDVRAAEHAALVMGLHFLRQQAVADAEFRVRSTFVEAVLQGRLGSDPALRERAQLLGFDLRGTYAAAVAVCADAGGRPFIRPLESQEEFQLRRRLAEAVEQALRALQLPAFLALELNQVVFLLPADSSARRWRDRVRLLHELLCAQVEPPAAVGVGRAQSDHSRLRASAEEARAALSVAHGPGVWYYEDALVLRVLHGCQDRDALEALHEATLGRLGAANPALELTAKVLVGCGFNQRAAARSLHLHWNTLRHRVARMEQLLGSSLDDPELRLRLHLAVLWDLIQQRAP